MHYNQVGPDFLRAYGIGLLLGRDIAWRDFGSPARTAVVNEAFARQYLDGKLPIGRRFCLGRRCEPAESFEIVGLAHDAKFDRVRGDVPPAAYISFTSGAPKVRPMTVAVHTSDDPLSIVGAVRDALRAADSQLSMMRIRKQIAQIDEMMLQERMFSRVSTLIGALALLLVAIGLYGTLAFAVARRTNEIGVRMSLGASRAHVLWMVLRESVRIALAGLLVGLPATLGLGRLIASFHYGIEPHDPPALISAAVLLAAICAAAGFLPARRAARIDPIRALHYE